MESQIIKLTAQKYGFDLCGIAKPEPLSLEKDRFVKAITENYHAQKPYLERDIDKRFNPELVLEHCKSVIVCGFNYYMGEGRKEQGEGYRVSKYAQIKDYHLFMKEKLENLAYVLQEKYGACNYKATIDSSGISEKSWAVKSGIGYYGKNGIIQTQFGSFVFLGILLIDKEVDRYDTPNQNNCGNCCICMETCPTHAIAKPYYVDCNRCITNILQNKNETDFSHMAKYSWLIACDECQNMCPNNAHATINTEAVALRAAFVAHQNEILSQLTPESFERYFKDTILYQYKYEGLKKRVEEIGRYDAGVSSLCV
jgi:epoxyqueuosine reductase